MDDPDSIDSYHVQNLKFVTVGTNFLSRGGVCNRP